MSGGRPELETVVAQAPRKSFQYVDLSLSNPNIAGNSGQSVTIVPPKGYIARVKAIYMNANAPTGATTGVHNFTVGYNGVAMLKGQSTYNKSITWNYSHWDSADSFALPQSNPDSGSFQVEFDNSNYLIVSYYNSTDKAQTGTVSIRVFYILEEVAG